VTCQLSAAPPTLRSSQELPADIPAAGKPRPARHGATASRGNAIWTPLGSGGWALAVSHGLRTTSPGPVRRTASRLQRTFPPSGACGIEFLPVPAACLGQLLVLMIRTVQSGIAVYYPDTRLDPQLAASLAQIAVIPHQVLRIERVEPQHMPGPRAPVIVMIEPQGMTAFLRADLIAGDVAAGLQDVLCLAAAGTPQSVSSAGSAGREGSRSDTPLRPRRIHEP
jgi:hypothetical protein